MVVNKLHYHVADGKYADHFKQTELDARNRCTGKTTGKALEMISKVLYNPNKKFYFDSGYAEEYFIKTCKRLVEVLELRFIEFRESDRSVVYNLFEDVDVDEAVKFYVQNKLKKGRFMMSMQEDFVRELQEVLNKYNADIMVDDHWTGYAECGQDIRMTVSFGDCTVDEVDLGGWVDGNSHGGKKSK